MEKKPTPAACLVEIVILSHKDITESPVPLNEEKFPGVHTYEITALIEPACQEVWTETFQDKPLFLSAVKPQRSHTPKYTSLSLTTCFGGVFCLLFFGHNFVQVITINMYTCHKK